MSMGNESSWVGRKPLRRIGGMSDALSIAADLGFSVSTPQPPQPQEALQNPSPASEKGEDLIKVLRELTTVQRKIADLQVELQGRKDDKNVAHLTHVSEMEKKIETLARITTILKDVIQNKDRIIARLQQPYSLDCIPVEAEYQKQFSELLMKAASDYGALTASVEDFHGVRISRNLLQFGGPCLALLISNVILEHHGYGFVIMDVALVLNDCFITRKEMLRPIPVALASCTRYFEAMSATRESFAALQKLRVGHSDSPLPRTPARDSSQRLPGVSDRLTPPPMEN